MSANTVVSVRGATKLELIRRFKAAGTLPENVFRTWPAEALERESLWFDKTTGDLEFPVMMVGEHMRNDVFTLRVMMISATEGQTVDECEDKCEAYMNAVVAVIANDMQLFGVVPGIVRLDITRADGPDAYPTDEGWMAQAEIDIECTTRVQ